MQETERAEPQTRQEPIVSKEGAMSISKASIITSDKLQEGGHRMLEQNKTLFKRFVDEVFNKKNVAFIDEFLAPSLVEHKEDIYAFLGAFPDLHVTVEDLIAEGDKIVGRVTLTGTHQGELMGIPATGKKVSFSEILIVRISNGKVVELSEVADTMSMMQQLGVIPS